MPGVQVICMTNPNFLDIKHSSNCLGKGTQFCKLVYYYDIVLNTCFYHFGYSHYYFFTRWLLLMMFGLKYI